MNNFNPCVVIKVHGSCLEPQIPDGTLLEVPWWDMFDSSKIIHGDLLIYSIGVKTFIKICVGLPGDLFEVRECALYLNKQPLCNPSGQHYIIPPKKYMLEGYNGQAIPSGCCLVLSAQTEGSLGDSTHMGLIDFSYVRGSWRIGKDDILEHSPIDHLVVY